MFKRHKKVFLFYAFLAILCMARLETVAQEGGRAKVFILAGQSNMVGKGKPAELSPERRAVPKNVAFYHGNAKQDSFAAGGYFGPEVAFSHEMAKAFPNETIIVVKHAVGGTSVLEWLGTKPRGGKTKNQPAKDAPDESLNNDPRGLFPTLMNAVATATKGLSVEYCAVVWEQGGRDAKYPETAPDYSKNLQALIERFRKITATPGLPFLFGEIATPVSSFPATEVVRACQRTVAREAQNVRLVETKGVTTGVDQTHFDSKGLLELGKRYANAYLGMINAETNKTPVKPF